MVIDVAFAALFAVLCWWLGTGVILWLDRQPVTSFRWSMLAWTFLLGLSFWGVSVSMKSVTDFHAYLGFGSVIVMWGWHELAFLTGTLTGPRKTALEEGATGLQRLSQSLQVVLHHELALMLNFGILCAMQSDNPNHLALCTFALLWCMRVSAKLNLFFGVPENGSAYLPDHLSYLATYFRNRRLTWWFVASISLSIAGLSWMIWQAQTGSMQMTTSWVLLASLLALAIVEHALMLFPLPLQRIWGWAMSAQS
jgi:putative photosynthetic complex assembly protein 2